MLFSQFLSLAALAGGALAQTTTSSNGNASTISLFLGVGATDIINYAGINPNSWAVVASVVAGDNDANTYALACTAGCPTSLTVTATVGPSTYAALTNYSAPDTTWSVQETCVITAGTANCDASGVVSTSAGGVAFNTQFSTAGQPMDTASYGKQVVITAGLDKLASQTGSSASSGPTSGSPASGSSGSSASSSSSSGSSPTTTGKTSAGHAQADKHLAIYLAPALALAVGFAALIA